MRQLFAIISARDLNGTALKSLITTSSTKYQKQKLSRINETD